MPISAGRRGIQWQLLGIAGAILFAMGWIGFSRYAAWHNLPNTLWDNLYLTLQLIPLESGRVEQPVPLELELARFFIPILAGAATAKVVWGLFRQQIRMMRLRGLRGHIIICGLSRKGLLLANEFRRQKNEVVIIEHNEENDGLEPCRVRGMYVLVGDAADPALLRQAGVQVAGGLFAVCDNDGINAEIAIQAQALVQERKGEPLACLVHVSDPKLCALLREKESSLESAPFRIELFNVFERGARRMLRAHPAWREEQLASGPAPSLLLLGLGRMGENVLLHIVRDWRSQQPDPSRRLKITIIDRRALQKIESLNVRYPRLAAACELTPLQMEIDSPEFERARFLFDEQGNGCLDTVYICVDDDSLGLHAGLTLQRQLRDQRLPVVIRMMENNGLAMLLENRKTNGGSFHNLCAFGYLDRTCTPALLVDTPRDRMARAAHAEYLQQQRRAAASGTGPVAARKASLQPWADLDAEYRKANYEWVDMLQLLLKDAGYEILPVSDWDIPSAKFSMEETEPMAIQEHELWCQARRNSGWRYAPGTQNLEAKTHPSLVSWEALPDSEKEKNRMLVLGIPAFLGRVGFQVCRVTLR